MTVRKKVAIETDVAQGMHYIDPASGSVVPPIMPSTTFARDENYALMSADNAYSRDDNPSFRTAEAMLTRLEGGADSMLFSSGMSAAAAVLQSLWPGDHVVAPTVMYWGLRNWMIEFCSRWKLDLDFFDAADPDDLARKVQTGRTSLVWVETPTNPTWDIIDIEAAAAVAHGAGALLAVDSTVSTPVLTRPIEFGADIVMHSATKYLNGHSDVVAGALITASENEAWANIADVRSEGGAILGSFEAWLLQRGMRTLFMRVRQASASALAFATHFDNHPAIEKVLYPGLESHPGHEIAKKQMQGGFGGMLSLCVNGGEEVALDVVKRCQVFIRATSLGSVESLIEHRYSIEGPDSPIPKNLVRVSVGVEAVGDLVEDLEQALG
ncbi:MAG: PLP-dependent aspartate aminotransferase family protein [Woeseiaceae bacterium]|nr:PLP-dependent aspartate aminotransferase family protein [Woeseiaceae bacterium]